MDVFFGEAKPERRKRWALIGASALAAAALIAAGVMALRNVMSREVDPFRLALDEKIADAEMVLSYEITAGRTVRMSLFPSDTEIKLITHVNVPRPAQNDNRRTYLYALLLELRTAKNELVWRREYWEKTQATKHTMPDGLVPWETALYVTSRDVMPSDNRMTSLNPTSRLPVPIDFVVRAGGYPRGTPRLIVDGRSATVPISDQRAARFRIDRVRLGRREVAHSTWLAPFCT
ncbi:hypothetical protein FJZ36_15715 [Candidatus Poribacteria bacterium]|nr:hypothetical protein [Candidatus Poribacteria bacterium]